VQRKTPDDGQRNCPKHVEFYSKSKFEKLVNLAGFIIRIYYDAQSPEHKKAAIKFPMYFFEYPVYRKIFHTEVLSYNGVRCLNI